MIRSFVAILLDDEVRAAVASTIERLRPLGSAVAWVPPQNLHVTLQFLGSQNDERLAAAEAALGDAVALSTPFDVTFHGIGAFPGLARPRVLWIGLAHGALEVRALQARVSDALAARGFPKEDRSWHPHLTIGRVLDDGRWKRGAGTELQGALARAATTSFGTLRVAEMALMRSRLSPTGARHTLRRALALNRGKTPGP